MKVIISGGGTGGHIFPAIAIADAIRKQLPDAQILFVGAEGKMEMERVPKAGYEIIGLPVVGFQRGKILANLSFPFKLLKSLWKAYQLVKQYQPDVCVGVGGYASGPILKMASRLKVPYVIQEQNSYAGVTNRLLAKGADAICVAYDNMAKFFPQEKITITGNPVRKDILAAADGNFEETKEKAYRYFGLSPKKKTIFVTGGSLGARTLNESINNALGTIDWANTQLIWQTGKYYENTYLPIAQGNDSIRASAFVDRMDYAYLIADVVVARAGALTISELCVMGKAAILIPSPNVAEDHQTANAKSLAEHGAAMLLPDANAVNELSKVISDLLADEQKLAAFGKSALSLAKPNADFDIANIIVSCNQKSSSI